MKLPTSVSKSKGFPCLMRKGKSHVVASQLKQRNLKLGIPPTWQIVGCKVPSNLKQLWPLPLSSLRRFLRSWSTLSPIPRHFYPCLHLSETLSLKHVNQRKIFYLIKHPLEANCSWAVVFGSTREEVQIVNCLQCPQDWRNIFSPIFDGEYFTIGAYIHMTIQ